MMVTICMKQPLVEIQLVDGKPPPARRLGDDLAGRFDDARVVRHTSHHRILGASRHRLKRQTAFVCGDPAHELRPLFAASPQICSRDRSTADRSCESVGEARK